MMEQRLSLVFLLACSFLAGVNGELSGILNIWAPPVTAYVDGNQVALPNSQTWWKNDRISLGNPGKDKCATLAISFGNKINAGNWIKGVFNNGDETDQTWKCSNTSQPGWEQPNFNDSSWQSASADAFGYYHFFWEGDASFLNAPFIWYQYEAEKRGLRYCRAKICNKCKEDKCYSCEDDNPCDASQPPTSDRYPHHNPNKFVHCSKDGTCFEGSDGEVITGYISADGQPITVYLNGAQTPLMNSGLWYKSGKMNLGNVPKGSCVTVAISYRNRWIKAYFTNGDQTDTTWKCSNETSGGWEQPSFNATGWSNAVTWGSGASWDFSRREGQSFLDSPAIWEVNEEPDGLRYCRKDICNN